MCQQINLIFCRNVCDIVMASTSILLLTTVIIHTSVGAGYHEKHNITSIPPEVTPGDTFLDIRANKISHIPVNAFISYSNLIWIYMFECGIQYIEEGAFRGLDKLNSLSIINNGQTLLLPPDFGPPTKSLVKITFWNSRVDQTATVYPYFKAFEKLHYLIIGLNYLNIRDADMLPPNLTVFKAPWSWIRIFPSIGIYAPLLQTLHMYSCGMYAMPVQNVTGLINLKNLNLKWNSIPYLPDISFMKDLEILELNWNQLKTLPDLYELPLRKQTLADNPLVCNKSLCWVRMWPWMKTSSIPSDTPICSLPPTMVRMRLMDVDPALMDCFSGKSWLNIHSWKIWLLHPGTRYLIGDYSYSICLYGLKHAGWQDICFFSMYCMHYCA